MEKYNFDYKNEDDKWKNKVNEDLKKLNRINLKLNDSINKLIISNTAFKEILEIKYGISISSKLTIIPEPISPSHVIVFNYQGENVEIPSSEFYITSEMISIATSASNLGFDSNLIQEAIESNNFNNTEAATLNYLIERVKKEKEVIDNNSWK